MGGAVLAPGLLKGGWGLMGPAVVPGATGLVESGGSSAVFGGLVKGAWGSDDGRCPLLTGAGSGDARRCLGSFVARYIETAA